MILDDLEKRLEETGDLEDFNKTISNLEQGTRNAVKLLLGLAHEFHSKGLDKEYVVFGGYAVLMHMVKAIGTEAIARWRGTYDLDIVMDEKVKRDLKSQLEVISDRKSERYKGKRTIKIRMEEAKEPYKIDLRMSEEFSDEPDKIYEDSTETIMVYNIPVIVPTLERELKDKLSTSRRVRKDDLDIVNLLGVYYLKKMSPTKLIRYLEHKERKRLYDLIKGFEGERFIKENVLIEIDNKYINKLKKALKKNL